MTVAVFYAVPRRLRLAVLLIANAVFFLWSDVSAGLWLLVSVLSTWAAGLQLERMGGSQRNRRAVLFATLALNIALLAFFQYLPVWERELNLMSALPFPVPPLDLAGRLGLAAPVGISFYTLQAAGYLFDIYYGKYQPEQSLFRYAVYVSFFPNLLSGPIERGRHFLTQLDGVLTAKRRTLLVYDRVAQGMIGILLGFFMKLVIADRAAILVDYLYGVYQDGNSFTMLMAALFYAVQIYCDFASYSCIAVGVAQLFGFELIRNFRQPYFACGISDFWRRWHISLSSWLRDYVYIPLGGNRRGAVRKEWNLFLVFLVSGIWHGGAPTFLLWGICYGMLAAGEDLLGRALRRAGVITEQGTGKRSREAAGGRTDSLREKFRDGQAAGKRRVRGGRHGGVAQKALAFLCRAAGVLLTFCLVSLLWVIFRSDSPEMAFTFLKNLFTRPQGFMMAREFLYVMGLNRAEFWIAVVSIALLFVLDLVSELTGKETALWIYQSPLVLRWGVCLLLLMMVFVFGRYGHGVDASGFIYVDF